MLIAIAVYALGALAPDLTCNYKRHVLVVDQRQWAGIRHALFKLDRKTLSALISDKHGIELKVHSATHGDENWEAVPKKRFLNIGKDSEYGPDSPSVMTDAPADTLMFKWFWVDLAHIEMHAAYGTTKRSAFDRHPKPAVWEIFGWMQRDKGEPSTRVTFGQENGRLVIKGLEISMEPNI